MKKIIKSNQKFEQHEKSNNETVDYLKNNNQPLKAEYAGELGERFENLSFYQNGPFTDMCEGPHVESTRKIPKGCFKLDSIAGSYWRGDSSQPMLMRIYGLAFESKDKLTQFIEERRLAQERDHRKLGRELDLYVMDDEVGQGLPLWLPNGTVLREELESLAKDMEFQQGYQKVATPHITKNILHVRSSSYYKDTMYAPMKLMATIII